MHLASHLRSAEEIIGLYNGSIPFAAWLKGYFKQHKKFGSKDRRTVSDLCFSYFRLGHAFAERTVEEQLLIGQFLCKAESAFVAELKPEWKHWNALPLAEKLTVLRNEAPHSFFPFLDEVSKQIDRDAFNPSHLIQPDLFLRIRPGRREGVLQKLEVAGVTFLAEDDCVRLPINTKLDDVLLLDEEAVVQDRSSQRVMEPLQSAVANLRSPVLSAWDCCAASGGKSILLHDAFPHAALTVSDVRESILHNLRNRFRRAGINRYQSFAADVSSATFSLNKKLDLVVCDAPCSGSGTWGRTPEQLRFFAREKIEHYASLQKAIAVNASRCLKKGGLFLYVTCSVFQKENEDVASHIGQEANLRLLSQDYFKGYDEKADTLFAAVFASGRQG